jgi:hypothetical protein
MLRPAECNGYRFMELHIVRCEHITNLMWGSPWQEGFNRQLTIAANPVSDNKLTALIKVAARIVVNQAVRQLSY